MGACGKISSGIIIDCTVRLVAGTMERVILINFDDWKAAAVTFDTITPNNLVITDVNFIGLGTGTYGFEFTGKKNSNDPLVEASKGTYDLYYKHSVGMKIFTNDPDAKLVIDGMSDSLVVAVVENKNAGTDGNSAFEVYGANAGLEIETSNRNPNDAETKGAWDLLLSNNADELEGHIPYTIWDTDYVTTKAIVDSLLDPVL